MDDVSRVRACGTTPVIVFHRLRARVYAMDERYRHSPEFAVRLPTPMFNN